mmetsp:Transcript_5109/g.11353  ORF Transcript_5109/g.11353 Transcript_5109/m.11353 type:complete len:149 (-) Transcript_5109:78-524(-)
MPCRTTRIDVDVDCDIDSLFEEATTGTTPLAKDLTLLRQTSPGSRFSSSSTKPSSASSIQILGGISISDDDNGDENNDDAFPSLLLRWWPTGSILLLEVLIPPPTKFLYTSGETEKPEQVPIHVVVDVIVSTASSTDETRVAVQKGIQ